MTVELKAGSFCPTVGIGEGGEIEAVQPPNEPNMNRDKMYKITRSSPLLPMQCCLLYGRISKRFSKLKHTPMGLILEEKEHPTIRNVSITVDDKEKGAMREPWEIMSLDINFADIRTPDDYISLGKWLIENSKRIKKEFTSTGKKRKVV